VILDVLPRLGEALGREQDDMVDRKKANPQQRGPEPDQFSELGDLQMTHPGRVLYPDDGITKLDLVAYYAAIADWILPHVVDRPLSVVRCPSGLDGKCFFQKHPVRGMPEAIARAALDDTGEEEYLFIRDLRGLVSLVQFTVLELHPWGAKVDRPERPDRMVFDLDPHESVPWASIVAAAHHCRERLDDLGLASFVKTTGGKGLHVVVPLLRRHSWSDVKTFSLGVAQSLMTDRPQQYTTNISKAARTGKILIDVNRNHRGATSVAAYSTRARSGAPVSLPLAWAELTAHTHPDPYHVGTVPARLATLKADPWADLPLLRQSITARMKRHVAAGKR
jgi:bifunctional non-homologous end joining protein LigD